jgi:sterol desaturase/sphingolipid hydroxylase (fatty acid hydroxylase superfamily)
MFFKCLIFFCTAVIYTLIEYLYSVIKNDNKYSNTETKEAVLSGLVLVITETTSALLFLFLTTKIYSFVWGSTPSSVSYREICIAIVLIDILYYFYHRVHHNNQKLFTIHQVHHVGTKYNLSLAIMLPWIGQASIYVMLVPLIFLHISPRAIIGAYFFILTYQLFCHMAYLKLPKWCDFFLVTPRNHRIHHYDDRESQMHNFGAVFSLWDRLLGTYSDTRKKEELFGIQGYTQIDMFDLQKKSVMQFFKKGSGQVTRG